MDSNIRLEYKPKTIEHPGETVVDYLEFNGWSQRDLARRTGLTPKTISEICNGKAPITPMTALAFERALKRPAHFWLNLQRQFEEAEARRNAGAKLSDWKKWAELFPLKVLEDYGWLELKDGAGSEVDALLTFLGVSSPDSWASVWEASKVAYRQTRRFQTTAEAISAWVRAVEITGSEIEVREFDEQGLRSSVEKIRHVTRKKVEIAIPEMQRICAEVGVAVTLVPELPHTGISGCARWINDRKAVIGLTLRYKKDDQFWFTFFHEVAHLLLHRKRREFIVDNAVDTLTDQVVDPQMQGCEEEANRFAADTLIPPDDLFKFMRKQEFTDESIKEFAKKVGVGPGIVVGRLQHEGLLQYYQGNALKQRINAKLPSK